VLGDAARFVEPGDRDELASTIADLLTGDGRDALVARGRAQAAEYSWDACAEGVASLYHSLC
jgi:glycosyltransferase involved in cell wall biosynthesis